MNPNRIPYFIPGQAGYVPYFYEAGLFQVYPVSHSSRSLQADDLVRDDGLGSGDRPGRPAMQTVEDVIARGYLAVPALVPEEALLTDRRDTAWLGLDDVIGQIRHRYAIYHQNIYSLELSKCAAINGLYEHEAYHGPIDARVKYAVGKRINDLYAEQRAERVHLWRDVSRLRLQLPENAQSYLSAYRKLGLLKEEESEVS